jgi:transposase
MPEPTTTIACRVPQPVKDQVEQIAASKGQSIGEWQRDLLMQAVHQFNPQSATKPATESISDLEAKLLRAFDERFQKLEAALREEIQQVKSAILQQDRSHHEDLCRVAEVGMNVEQSMEQRIEGSVDQILEAIARLGKLQRSHKNMIVHAIGESTQIEN